MGNAVWWDERFRSRENVLMPPEAKLELDLKYFEESHKILDLACGDGRNSVYLTKIGYKVYAVDFSIVALNRLKSFARNEGLEIKTKLTDISAIDEVSKLELKVDAIVVNHYRVFHTVEAARNLLHKKDINILHEVAADGASELLAMRINEMSEEDYAQYLRYHFYICEKPEMIGMTNHLLFVGEKDNLMGNKLKKVYW